MARATFKISGILSRGNGVERTRFQHPRNALLPVCRALGGGKKWPHFGPKRHLLNPRRPLLRRIHTTHASTAYPTRFRGVSHVLDDTQPTPIDLAPGGFTDNVSFFVNVVFPQAGTYWVQTLCDQHVMEEFPLIVADQGSVSTMQPPDQVSETIN